MAKWKGPFTVTKIPNRFQIEYLDGNVTRLTHISYVKKYNERCQYAKGGVMPRPGRVSRVKPWVRMARIRLIAGKGRYKIRLVVPSVKAIRDKWPVHVGRIRVQVLGDGEPLPSGLQAIVEAAGSDAWIEGVLWSTSASKGLKRGVVVVTPLRSLRISLCPWLLGAMPLRSMKNPWCPWPPLLNHL